MAIFAIDIIKQRKMMNPTIKKSITIVSILVLVALASFIYIRYYFVFGEGVKAGELNYFVHKGYIFKTYEGKMIQSGFKSKTANTIQSYEFSFSVTDKSIADSLMRCSGKEVELHYKEYFGTIPWRGVNTFVVDGIISVK